MKGGKKKKMITNGQDETENISVSHENLGTINKNKVSITTSKGGITLFFSYSTIVGFCGNGDDATLQNYWSNTTVKLLNELEPDHSKRVEQAEFNRRLNMALKRLVLTEEELTEKEI